MLTREITETIDARTTGGHVYAIEFCPWRCWDEYRVTRDGEVYADLLRIDEARAVVGAAGETP